MQKSTLKNYCQIDFSFLFCCFFCLFRIVFVRLLLFFLFFFAGGREEGGKLQLQHREYNFQNGEMAIKGGVDAAIVSSFV